MAFRRDTQREVLHLVARHHRAPVGTGSSDRGVAEVAAMVEAGADKAKTFRFALDRLTCPLRGGCSWKVAVW